MNAAHAKHSLSHPADGGDTRKDGEQRGNARPNKRDRPVLAARARTTALCTVPPVFTIGRGEHGRVDRHRILRLRDDCGRECLDSLAASGFLCVIGEEDECSTGRGHLDGTCVLSLVALDGLDGLLSLPATV